MLIGKLIDADKSVSEKTYCFAFVGMYLLLSMVYDQNLFTK